MKRNVLEKLLVDDESELNRGQRAAAEKYSRSNGMFAEVVDAARNVVVRAERDVSKDGDIIELAGSAIDQFRRANPDTSFIH